MIVHIAAVWLYLLLSGFFLFGLMVAGLLRAGAISRLEDEKRALARQLAVATSHPSVRPSARRLRVVGSDGARIGGLR